MHAGKNHFIGGKLVPSSIDAYLVMEFADGGDLFGLRGQLAATEVRSLMAQLLDGLQYLHSQVRGVLMFGPSYASFLS